MLNNHKSSSNLNVGGKMSEEGADRAGLIQSLALVGFSVASIILAISALILALK